MGPAPKMTAVSPGARALFRMACWATQAGSVMARASMGVSGLEEGTKCHAEGRTTYSAKLPSRREPM